jgi:hypothetical protein
MRYLYASLLLLVGCTGNSGNYTKLESALATGGAVGYTSALAIDGIGGTPATCVSVTAGCTTFPCDGSAKVALGTDCTWPLGAGAAGEVDVSAHFTSADSSTVSSTFVGATAGGKAVAVVSTKSVTVSRSNGTLTIQYVQQNVDTSSTTLGAQSSWTVAVAADGTETLNGSDQAAGTTTDQLSLTDVVISPSCKLNPTGGSAVVQHVSLTNITNTTVKFHSACDGKADADGSSITLSLTP